MYMERRRTIGEMNIFIGRKIVRLKSSDGEISKARQDLRLGFPVLFRTRAAFRSRRMTG